MTNYQQAIKSGRIICWMSGEYYAVTDNYDQFTYLSSKSYKDAAKEWADVRDIDLRERVA